MFKVTPDKVKVIFIVREDLKDAFSEHIYSLGYQWFRYDWEKLSEHFESKDCLLLLSSDKNLSKLFSKIDDPLYLGKFIYLIGAREYFDRLNLIGHFIFTKQDEWKEFNTWYKQVNGHDFNSLLKITDEVYS